MREKEPEFIKTVFWEKTKVLQENTIFCKRTSFVSKSRVSLGNNILWENEKCTQAKAKFLGKMQNTVFWAKVFSGKQYLSREQKVVQAKATFPGKPSTWPEKAKFLCDLNILQEKVKDLWVNAKFCKRIQKFCKRMKGHVFLNHYGMVYNYGYEI